MACTKIYVDMVESASSFVDFRPLHFAAVEEEVEGSYGRELNKRSLGHKITTCMVLIVLSGYLWSKYANRTFYQKEHYHRNPTNKRANSKTLFNDDPLEIIRRDCGQLCNTSRLGSPGPYFNHITTHINCMALFENEYIDRPHGLPKSPRNIPRHLLKDFTMDGRLEVEKVYFDEPILQKIKVVPIWTEKLVNNLTLKANKDALTHSYGEYETNALREALKHAQKIKNGRVLVIGSLTPWVEALVLEAGASKTVTLEYGEILSKHPKIQTMTPRIFRMKYLNNSLGLFDAVVTFSSIEHSGLGRYGDALNPWGDIIAIARAWCVTKYGGTLTIGVPYDSKRNYLKFNGGRRYGPVRYPYLTTNWRQLYRSDRGLHRVHIFTRASNL